MFTQKKQFLLPFLLVGCLFSYCPNNFAGIGNYKMTLITGLLAGASIKSFLQGRAQEKKQFALMREEIPNFKETAQKMAEAVAKKNRDNAFSNIHYYVDWDKFIEFDVKPKNPDLAKKLQEMSKSSYRFVFGSIWLFLAAGVCSPFAYAELTAARP